MKYTEKQIEVIKSSIITQECCKNCVYTNSVDYIGTHQFCNILKGYVNCVCKCSEYKKAD